MSATVTQADREAAASAYFAWIGGNPVIPTKMRAGEVDDHSMVQAFARHRIAGDQDANPATEIGKLSRRILALAPSAGLYVGIKIEPAKARSAEFGNIGADGVQS